MLDFNLVRCFQIVGECGSLSKASTQLHISQPAISIQIKKLEDQLGKKLFDRHNRGLTLTNFGKNFLQLSKKLKDLEFELKESLKTSEEGMKVVIRVGTYSTASSYLLSNPVMHFLRKNPNSQITYSYDTVEETLKKIKTYDLDCGVLTDVPSDPLIEATPFFKDELILAGAKENQYPKEISKQVLTQFEFLSYPLRYDFCYRSVEAKLGAYLSKSKVVLESESFDTLKQMLIKGAGVTFIPKYLIQKELDSKIVTEIKIPKVQFPITFSFLTKKDAILSKTLQKFKYSVLGVKF